MSFFCYSCAWIVCGQWNHSVTSAYWELQFLFCLNHWFLPHNAVLPRYVFSSLVHRNPVLYRNDWTNRVGFFFGMESSFHLSSTVIKKYGYLQKLGYFLLGLVSNSGLRKFRHDHSNGKKYRRDFFCIIRAILVFGVWWGSVGPYSTVTLWILNWHDKLWKFTLNSSAH